MFNYRRLTLARKRRRLTGKALAQKAGVSPVTISRVENGENADEETAIRVARALDYPVSFFMADDPEELATDAVSFRSLTKMSARERDAALGAGALGLELSDWVEERFSLPTADLLDLSQETDPEVAARLLRQHWAIGEKPIGNVLSLLESKGIRVFSLSENTATVDAFSFWRDEKPYIFLNNFKSAEHSIFDACHELGHLVLHKHGGAHEGAQDSRAVERDANAFASAFLMPANDVRARVPRPITVADILHAKVRWRISAMAMAYRLNHLGLLSEWQYKSVCIDLTRRGYRKGEPNGIERETSRVWPKVLTQLWNERKTKADIARELNIPLDELEGLIWGITGPTTSPQPLGKAEIRLVGSEK